MRKNTNDLPLINLSNKVIDILRGLPAFRLTQKQIEIISNLIIQETELETELPVSGEYREQYPATQGNTFKLLTGLDQGKNILSIISNFISFNNLVRKIFPVKKYLALSSILLVIAFSSSILIRIDDFYAKLFGVLFLIFFVPSSFFLYMEACRSYFQIADPIRLFFKFNRSVYRYIKVFYDNKIDIESLNIDFFASNYIKAQIADIQSRGSAINLPSLFISVSLPFIAFKIMGYNYFTYLVAIIYQYLDLNEALALPGASKLILWGLSITILNAFARDLFLKGNNARIQRLNQSLLILDLRYKKLVGGEVSSRLLDSDISLSQNPPGKLSLQAIALLPIEERHQYLQAFIPAMADDFCNDPEMTEFNSLDVEDWDVGND